MVSSQASRPKKLYIPGVPSSYFSVLSRLIALSISYSFLLYTKRFTRIKIYYTHHHHQILKSRVMTNICAFLCLLIYRSIHFIILFLLQLLLCRHTLFYISDLYTYICTYISIPYRLHLLNGFITLKSNGNCQKLS